MKKNTWALTVAALVVLSLVNLGTAQTESHDESEERRGLDVSVSAIRAQVSPQLEIVLPSGDVAQHFEVSFNRLDMTFNLFYRVVDGNVGGDITFALPLGRFTPNVSFFQSVDFEKLVEPQVSGGEVALVPSSKYLERQRGFRQGISCEFARNLSIEPSFTVNDIFKGNLSETIIIDEGVDLIPRVSLTYDGYRVRETERGFYFNGFYGRSTYSLRYRTRFSNPISAGLENQLLAGADIDERFFLEEELTFDTPVTVWDEEDVNFYSLGGFGSARGYGPDSINAFRFLRSSLDLEQRVFGDGAVTIWTSRKKGRFIRIDQFRLLYLFDLLVAQDELDIRSSADTFTSLGAGFSFTLSGSGSSQFKTQIFAAQALDRDFAPIIYLRTSLFNLETGR